MKETDKKLTIDTIRISGTAALTTVNPLLVPAWELCAALFGTVMERRKDKAKEWIELFTTNKEKFSKKIFDNENFQDAFINCFEQYLRERNEEKRKMMRQIFLGFSTTPDFEEMPIEKYYFILNTVSSFALLKLQEIKNKAEQEEFFQPNRTDIKFTTESTYELVNLGILIVDPSARLGSIDVPFVKLSNFGKEFIKYLDN